MRSTGSTGHASWEVTILSHLPMVVATGPELQRPLAVVVIGDRVTSTILTLVVLPMLYSWIEDV